MNESDATALAMQIWNDTGLQAHVSDDDDGHFWVDVDLPTVGHERRFMVTAHDADDWPWLYEKYVRARLDPTH